MKKTFSWIAALVTAMMLFVAGCSNASQVTFEDESKEQFTEFGLSALSVSIGKTPEYRAFYPNDWSDDQKQKLFYKLTGEIVKGQPTATVGGNISAEFGKGAEFSFAEIDGGRAVVQLDPIHWKLVLTAYEGKSTTGGVVIDENKPVLTATIDDVDLTKGATDVVFDLKPMSTGTPAPGLVDIQVNFTINEKSPAKTVEFNIVDIGTGNTSALIMGNDNPPSKAIEQTIDATSGNKVAVLKTNPVSTQSTEVKGVKPGDYNLVVTFKDGATNQILQLVEKIKIDSGNLTKAVINISADKFNAPPEPPVGLRGSCYFAPEEASKVVLDEAKKLYAQQVVENTNKTIDAVTGALAAAITDNKYNLVLKWQDKSFSETGFKVSLTTTKNASSNVEFAYNKSASSGTVDITDNENIGITVVAGTDDLGPGCETITLAVPTGVFCKDITVTAVNSLGEGKSDPIANSATVQANASVSKKEIPAADPIGMFTVAYNLGKPTTVTGPELANVIVPGTTIEKAAFLMAYNYGATDDLITGNVNTYPHVEDAKYVFNGWRISNGAAADAVPVEIKKLSDFNAKPDGQMATGKSLLNKNVEVYGSWTTPATIKVTFPSYSDYMELKAVVDQNPLNTIVPVDDSTGKKVVTLTANSVAKDVGKIEDVTFTIYDPYGDNTPLGTFNAAGAAAPAPTPTTPVGVTFVAGSASDSTGGDKLTWDITEFLKTAGNHGDVYRINVSYTYAKANPAAPGSAGSSPVSYGTPVIVDGNLFVKVSK